MLITVVKQKDRVWPSEPIGLWKVLELVRIWHIALQGDVFVLHTFVAHKPSH